MTEQQAEALNEFLMENWVTWELFCKSRDIDPYNDAFVLAEIPPEGPEDNSCQICGADGGTTCGAVNCVY